VVSVLHSSRLAPPHGQFKNDEGVVGQPMRTPVKLPIRTSYRELYRIYREPAAVNRGRYLLVLRGSVYLGIYDTLHSATFNGFITICLNSLTFYNRDFENNAIEQDQQLLREVLVTVSSILIAGLMNGMLQIGFHVCCSESHN
jgi:hypothetical protein